jgi:hypothetical protein
MDSKAAWPHAPNRLRSAPDSIRQLDSQSMNIQTGRGLYREASERKSCGRARVVTAVFEGRERGRAVLRPVDVH